MGDARATHFEVESEAISEGVERAPPEVKPSRRLALVASVLGCALVAGALARRATPTAMPPEAARGRAISLESRGLVMTSRAGPWSTKRRTGCKNWQGIYLARGVYDTEKACGDICQATPGCRAFNYQELECANTDDNTGGEKRACYLQSGDCVEYTNTCWDLHVLDSPLESSYCMTDAGMGCRNYKELLVYRTVVNNEAACSLECKRLKDNCTHFNFQPGSCPEAQEDRRLGYKEGACLIFNSGECEKMNNTCWDLYLNKPCSALRRASA